MDSEYKSLRDFVSSEVDRKGHALVPVLEIIENFDIDENDNQEMRKDITELCHRISDDLKLEASFQFSSEFVEFQRIYDA